ncbi:MAG TPA: acylphosphatase [Candidatus Acidoferrum sp.]|nr:acylphosphatase [Candidatus Acidoferrum sp.]
MVKTRAHVFVSGIVQGVFFRQKTKRQAQNLGVMGWVRNLDDGRVEAVFEGEKNAVEALVEYCHHGPSSARVDRIEVDYKKFTGEFNDFATQ